MDKALYPFSVRHARLLPLASSRPCIAATPLPLATGSAQNGPEWICTTLKRAMSGAQKKRPLRGALDRMFG